jgi:hypothetical protein
MEDLMSDAQNSLSGTDAEPGSPESERDHASGLMGMPNGENRTELQMEDGADLGGHTLLSRPSAQQGRRSLFRR